MLAGRSQLAVVTVEAMEVVGDRQPMVQRMVQRMAQGGAVGGVLLGVVLITALATATLMRQATIRHQWCTQLLQPRHNRWYWQRNHNHQFGITVKLVGNIFRMYKAALRAGKHSQQYRRLVRQATLHLNALKTDSINRRKDSRTEYETHCTDPDRN